MTTAAQLRKASLAQEGAEQADGRRAWLVSGVEFASIEADGRAMLALAPEPSHRMAEELDGVEVRSGGVRVDLSVINGMALNFWVRQAWKHCAPASLSGAATEAARAAASQDDDFGPIGAPARRALHGAGIADLAALADRASQEVEALHGVGPTAMRILREALAEQGTTW